MGIDIFAFMLGGLTIPFIVRNKFIDSKLKVPSICVIVIICILFLLF